MRRALIDEQNAYALRLQRDFRAAADVLARAFSAFDEVVAVAVIGSVAKPLWKEVPRFPEFRRAGIEVWHECGDLDLAVWVAAQQRLGELRSAAAQALREAREADAAIRISDQQLDVFLFAPATDRYLGRLCGFNQCPKGKPDCLVPGCGEVPFNKRIPEFTPRADLLASVQDAMLYRRGRGHLMTALDLPAAVE
jgi:hypothetical protein